MLLCQDQDLSDKCGISESSLPMHPHSHLHPSPECRLPAAHLAEGRILHENIEIVHIHVYCLYSDIHHTLDNLV